MARYDASGVVNGCICQSGIDTYTKLTRREARPMQEIGEALLSASLSVSLPVLKTCDRDPLLPQATGAI